MDSQTIGASYLISAKHSGVFGVYYQWMVASLCMGVGCCADASSGFDTAARLPHQGSTRTKQRARQIVYWTLTFIFTVQTVPGPLAITSTRAYHNEPDRPFQEVVADFCSYAGWEFLILVDCYTDWPDEVFIQLPHVWSQRLLSLWCA